MKTVNYIHFFIQLIFTLLIAAVLVGALMLEDNNLFILLYIAIPLGAYHVLTSLLHVIYKRGKSPLTLHLIVSIIYLFFFYMEANNIAFIDFGDLKYFLGVVIPSMLALYSFVVAFYKLNPFRSQIR